MALTRVRHIAVALHDLPAAAKLYRKLLELPVVREGTDELELAAGATVLRFSVPRAGEAAEWLAAIGGEGGMHHICFETDAPVAEPGGLLDREAHLGLGIALTPAGAAPALPPMTGPVQYVDHVVIGSNDSGRTAAWFAETLGVEIKRKMIRPETNAQLAFAKLGEVILEFAGPPEPRPGPHLARYFGIVLAVTGLDELVARIRAAGIETTDPRAAVQPGARIVTVKGNTGGVPFALIEYGPRPG
ncbi:MAG: VOC family protein [Dehalococcoidia bacterium]|nr:VOC family protein [Dehalococcoidia bacterium]